MATSSSVRQKIIFFIQDLQPITPFYTNIMKEFKGFTINEISNKITPYFFYASFLTIIITFFILEHVSEYFSIFVTSIIPVISLVVFNFMGYRNFLFAQFCYGLAGSMSAFKTILRSVLIKDTSTAAASMAKLKFIKYFSVSLSGWIGQEIYYQTRSYDFNLYLSIITTSIATVLSFFEKSFEKRPIEKSFFRNITTLNGFIEQIKNVYDRDLTMGVLCGSSSACLQIFLSMYGQSIFHEKNAETDGMEIHENKILKTFGFIVHTPIKFISAMIIKLASVFFNIPKYNHNTKLSNIASGYIEGTVKLLAIISSQVIIRNTPKEYYQNVYLIFFVLSILFFFILPKCKSMTGLKIFYFVCLSCIMTTENMAKSFVHFSKHKAFVICVCLLCESLIHSVIGSICRAYSFKVTTKSYFYSFLSVICLSIIISMRLGFF